ncbi:MAG: hypothetical protein HY322_02480 [Betaproteobacteria bacterium]|nr:hypothetical protein [Betaproteobacteria bacterium]
MASIDTAGGRGKSGLTDSAPVQFVFNSLQLARQERNRLAARPDFVGNQPSFDQAVSIPVCADERKGAARQGKRSAERDDRCRRDADARKDHATDHDDAVGGEILVQLASPAIKICQLLLDPSQIAIAFIAIVEQTLIGEFVEVLWLKKGAPHLGANPLRSGA